MPARKRPSVGFTYDPRTGRYRTTRTGRFLSNAEVRRTLDIAIAKSTRRVERLAAQLRTGSISVEEYEIAMRTELKSAHLIATLAAKGGREQITQADYGRAGQRLQVEYGYLARLTDGINNGTVKLDGQFTRRSAMYAAASRGTFHDIERSEQLDRGYFFEANVIQPGDSCRGCTAATAAGRVPIGTLPRIGGRDCKANCQCRLEYFKSA